MARRADPNAQVHGAPCNKCGSTLRYRASGLCVACSRQRSAARSDYFKRYNAGKRGLTIPPARETPLTVKPFPISKIATALSHAQATPAAIERNRRLDDLIRKAVMMPVEDKPAPTCYGDVHRAQLQVGAAPTFIHGKSEKAEYAVAGAAIVAAVEAMLDELPAVVTLTTVLERLDPDLLIGSSTDRVRQLIGLALAKCGAVKRKDGKTSLATYVIRDHQRYENKTTAELLKLATRRSNVKKRKRVKNFCFDQRADLS